MVRNTETFPFTRMGIDEILFISMPLSDLLIGPIHYWLPYWFLINLLCGKKNRPTQVFSINTAVWVWLQWRWNERLFVQHSFSFRFFQSKEKSVLMLLLHRIFTPGLVWKLWHSCRVGFLRNLKNMFQYVAGISTLTWNCYLTDVTSSTVVIFICEMKPRFGSFLHLAVTCSCAGLQQSRHMSLTSLFCIA